MTLTSFTAPSGDTAYVHPLNGMTLSSEEIAHIVSDETLPARSSKEALSLGKGPILGAELVDNGALFAVYAPRASQVFLCLFRQSEDPSEYLRIALTPLPEGVWKVFVDRIREGQLYGYRVEGTWDPDNGDFFNPQKLLTDPYARAVTPSMEQYDPSKFFTTEVRDGKLVPNTINNADVAPRSVLLDTKNYRRTPTTTMKLPMEKVVIAELHVRGATKKFPGIDEEKRGTYAGLAESSVLQEIKKVANVIELLPIQAGASEPRLLFNGLTNYWNYNSFAFSAVDSRYAHSQLPTDQVQEFRQLVQQCHAHDLKVILDVVFNHTAEGKLIEGVTLSLKGFDGKYYNLHHDFTGCGNMLDSSNPKAIELVVESLAWFTDLGVDGFRFDLAPILALNDGKFSSSHSFFQRLREDPRLKETIFIAEPWSATEEHYSVGKFPPEWFEWNDKSRDDVYDFLMQRGRGNYRLALRLLGSPDLFLKKKGKGINKLTSHDGFTGYDRWRYRAKHNWANKEHNHDGNPFDRSQNCGIEGETTDESVLHLRERYDKQTMATRFLMKGPLLIPLGDTLLQTQQGNNNAYCQNSDLSWLNWGDEKGVKFKKFVEQLYAFRMRENAVTTLRGKMVFLNAEGRKMQHHDWRHDWTKSLAALYLPEKNAADAPILALFNADSGEVPYILPTLTQGHYWELVLNSSEEDPFTVKAELLPGKTFFVPPHSVAVFKSLPLPLPKVDS